jgi:hypothetical protein
MAAIGPSRWFPLVRRMTAIGASSSLPDAPAKVPSQSDLPTFVAV